MQLVTVSGGTARIGAGHPVSLSKQQAADRDHMLEKDRKVHGERVIVKGVAPLEFKAGEIIGLAEVPKNAAHLLRTPKQIEEAREAEKKAAADKASAATRAKITAEQKSGNNKKPATEAPAAAAVEPASAGEPKLAI